MSMTQTNVYTVRGEVAGTIDVPEVFSSEYRPDVIKRAILAAAARRLIKRLPITI
jgi:large subunit ribosomal protein L4e